MADIYRRCGCRDDEGRTLGSKCPRLSDPKHGTWGFAVSGGVHPGTGRRVQVRKMGFATKREAQQERAKVVDQIATGRWKGERKLTVAEYLPTWLDRREREGLRASTARMYRRYLELDIVPALGHVKLADLRRHHVDAHMQALIADGRGATTVRRIHATISSALSAAEKLDLVDFNAASKLALPSVRRERMKVWEPDQVRAFLDLATSHRYGVIFETAVFTGLRRGELAGLRWADVDLTRRELVVRQQRVQLGKAVIEGAIKTDSGQDRRVSLGDEAIGALVAWRLRQDQERAAWAEAWTDTGYVFTRENGEPVRPAHISRVFDDLVNASGLPDATFHSLRHVHASLLLSAGVPLGVVSKRLGHSTIAITSDLYSHLLEDANRAAAEAAESVLPPRASRIAHTVHTREAGN